MNEYTIVFKTRFSGAEHRWTVKQTSDNFVVARSAWFKTRAAMFSDLIEFLSWLKTAKAN